MQHEAPTPSPSAKGPVGSNAAASVAAHRFGWTDALVLAQLIVSLFSAVFLVRSPLLHGNDFKHLWAGALALARGLSPYDPRVLFEMAAANGWVSSNGIVMINPFVYLPTTGLLLRPLALLDFSTARDLWFWGNWTLAWVLVVGGPGWLRVPRPGVARLAGAAFLAGAHPFMRQMTAGQMNVVAAALILAAAIALRRRRDPAAGAALALAFAWKIAPAFLIAVLLPLKRARAAAWALLFSAGLLAGSVLMTGWPVHREALALVREMGYGQSTWDEYGKDFYRDPWNQSTNSLLHHLFAANPYAEPWIIFPPVVANGLTWAVSLSLLILWLHATLRRPPAADLTPRFLAASVLMLLLPSLMWDHYAVQLLPALIWLFGHQSCPPTLNHASRRAATVLCPLGALAIFALLIIPWRCDANAWRQGLGIPLMSLRLWPTLALFFWLTLRPDPAQAD